MSYLLYWMTIYPIENKLVKKKTNNILKLVFLTQIKNLSLTKF